MLLMEAPYFKNHCDIVRRRQWHPTPVLLPGKSHGQRSLVGCCPWGSEESDTTERLHFHVSLSCIGEGNGNPLQCSCLENPRGSGAWWAAVSGVAQSRTRLMRLSRSSSSVGLLHILDTQGMRGENQQLINKSCPSKGFSQTLYFLGGPNMSRYVSSLKQSCTNSERL